MPIQEQGKEIQPGLSSQGWNPEERVRELRRKENGMAEQRSWRHMPTGEIRLLTFSEYLEERRKWITGER